ncbi:MAG TPA: lysophospholipid acyltransferase family protein [Phycisphaerae bacterium]|nr:lysophospholipid acyltransferase family protein [Phycisphaerae bacterium]
MNREAADNIPPDAQPDVIAPKAKPLVRFILALGNLHRRCLGFVFALIGPKISYTLTGYGARVMYWLLVPLKERSEALCGAALAGRVPEGDIPAIARQSFINRSRNLTDLMLAAHRLNQGNYERVGGKLPEPFLSCMLAAQRERRPVILVTGYYGSFDMLPIFLGYNGVKTSAVYLPHPNRGFDEYRKRIRGQSGCELIPVQSATTRLEQVLEDGGTVALVADHHASRRGIEVEFLGIPTRAMSTVGILACRHGAEVVTAGLRRVGTDFRFQFEIEDTIMPDDWKDEPNPVEWVTRRYMKGIEQLILREPAHYLWGYARWGEAHARQITSRTKPESEENTA